MQSVMDKFWGTAQDQYKGICQSYSPAPSATLQLTDDKYNAAADAAAGVGAQSSVAAAAPDQAQMSYQQLKEVCVAVDKLVKEYTSCALPKER